MLQPVHEAPNSAGASEGEGLATGVKGSSMSTSTSGGRALTGSGLKTQKKLKTLVRHD